MGTPHRRRPHARLIVAGLGFVLVAIGAVVVLTGSSEPAEIRSATVSNDGRRLAVEHVAPDETCGGESRIDVEETGSEVIITVDIDKPFELGTRTCLPRGRILSSEIDLADPLGERAVIDGSTARPIPLVEPD